MKSKTKEIRIKDKEALIRVFKTISWLDSWRWKYNANYNFINFFSDELTNCEKILTHWITYITDRQMPFEVIWDKGGYIFSEMVYDYSRSKITPQEILKKYYTEYKDKNGKKRFKFISTHSDLTFASRFVTTDHQNILQTLETLDHYQRNIIVFIIEIIRKYQGKDDLLIRVACGLHLLTYQLDRKKANPKKIMKTLSNSKEFEKELEQFKKTSTEGKKRLWCCIRDYKKGLYNKIFNDAIKEVNAKDAEILIKIWNGLPMDQIELPGDVWNNSPLFKDNLFSQFLDLESIPKTWGMPKIIRELYNMLKDDEEIKGFYPEQFDITFDFVPRMCNKKLCNVCLFGKNGVDLTCIPTSNKYCPVALLSCGYVTKCEENMCIIKKSKGICKGIIR